MKYSALYHVFPATFHVISRKVDFRWESAAGWAWWTVGLRVPQPSALVLVAVPPLALLSAHPQHGIFHPSHGTAVMWCHAVHFPSQVQPILDLWKSTAPTKHKLYKFALFFHVIPLSSAFCPIVLLFWLLVISAKTWKTTWGPTSESQVAPGCGASWNPSHE